MSDGPSTNSSRISPSKPKAGEPSSARNHSRSPDEDTERDGLLAPSFVDEKNSISSNEDCFRPTFKPMHGHERSKHTVRENASSKGGTSGPRDPGKRNASRRTPRGDPHRASGRKGQCIESGAARAGNEWHQKDRRQGRRLPEDAEKCSQSSSNDCLKDVEDQKIARTRDKKKLQHGPRRGAEHSIAKTDDGIDEQGNVAETEVDRTTDRKGTGDTDFKTNGRSMGEQDIRLNVQRSNEEYSDDDDDDGDSNGGGRELGKASIARDVERVESRSTQLAGHAATSGAMEGRCGTDDDKKSFRPGHGCVESTPLRTCSSDSENVETIELDVSVDRNCTSGDLADRQHSIGQVQRGMGGPVPEKELKRSNQDEERELDEAMR